jgi:hypothetical protein
VLEQLRQRRGVGDAQRAQGVERRAADVRVLVGAELLHVGRQRPGDRAELADGVRGVLAHDRRRVVQPLAQEREPLLRQRRLPLLAGAEQRECRGLAGAVDLVGERPARAGGALVLEQLHERGQYLRVVLGQPGQVLDGVALRLLVAAFELRQKRVAGGRGLVGRGRFAPAGVVGGRRGLLAAPERHAEAEQERERSEAAHDEPGVGDVRVAGTILPREVGTSQQREGSESSPPLRGGFISCGGGSRASLSREPLA